MKPIKASKTFAGQEEEEKEEEEQEEEEEEEEEEERRNQKSPEQAAEKKAMGRRKQAELVQLKVVVPSFFRCPISLEVMKSPVSLCTGVTYDRSSIEQWLAAGNNTCPATMQVLLTPDLVPNHTLRRLIAVLAPPPTPTVDVSALLRSLSSSSTSPLPPLRLLSDLAKSPDALDRLLKTPDSVASLAPLLGFGTNNSDSDSETLDLAVGILARILDNSSDVAAQVAGSEELLLRSLTGSLAVADPDNSRSVDGMLSCLIALSAVKRIRTQIIRLGVVPSLGKILSGDSTPPSTAEKSLKLLEMAAACTEGRAAICKAAGTVVTAAVGRIIKVSPAATEHAVVVLWSVCHLFRDRRAQEAVVRSNGLTKILLLLQSGCSPAARQMGCDLLRIFRVNSKSCLASYDTKTTHIMPF